MPEFTGRLRTPRLASAPSTPVAGEMYYDTTTSTLYWWNGTAWVSASGGGASDATTGAKGIVQLAGDLAGTAASPQIAAGVITDTEVAAANKNGASGTPSMRTTTMAVAGAAMPGDTDLGAISRLLPAQENIRANGKLIVNVLDPTGAQDAATKNYVDSVAQGLDAKQSVKAATTTNITLSGTQTIDGISCNSGNRVLVKNQTTPSQNGLYSVSTGAWTRLPEADFGSELASAFVFVEQGTVQADTGWVCTADAAAIIGTDPMPWTQFSGAGGGGGAAEVYVSASAPSPRVGETIWIDTDADPPPSSLTFRTGQTWVVGGALSAGQVIPPFFVPVIAGQASKIIGSRSKLGSGTSIGYQLTRNGSNVGTSEVATTTASTETFTPVTVADDDEIGVALSSPSGSPANLSLTVYLEHLT